jgi:hypothetical protein
MDYNVEKIARDADFKVEQGRDLVYRLLYTRSLVYRNPGNVTHEPMTRYDSHRESSSKSASVPWTRRVVQQVRRDSEPLRESQDCDFKWGRLLRVVGSEQGGNAS